MFKLNSTFNRILKQWISSNWVRALFSYSRKVRQCGSKSNIIDTGHIRLLCWLWYFISFQCNVSSKGWIIDLTLTYISSGMNSYSNIFYSNLERASIEELAWCTHSFCQLFNSVSFPRIHVLFEKALHFINRFICMSICYDFLTFYCPSCYTDIIFFFTFIHLHSSKDLISSTCDICLQMKHKMISIFYSCKAISGYVKYNNDRNLLRMGKSGRLKVSYCLNYPEEIISFWVYWIVKAARYLRRRIC